MPAAAPLSPLLAAVPVFVAPVVAKVRIRISLPGPLGEAIAWIGLGLIAIALAITAVAIIKREGRTGWFWLFGWLVVAWTVLATAAFAGEQSPRGGTYPLMLAIVAVSGLGAIALLRAAQRFGSARVVALLLGVALLLKVVFEPVLDIVEVAGDWEIMPPTYTHPFDLATITAAAVFVLVGWGWKAPRPAGRRAKGPATP